MYMATLIYRGQRITSIHDYCIDHRQYTLQGSIWFADKAHMRFIDASDIHAHMSPALLKICNGIIFNFYSGLPLLHTSILLSLSPYHSLSVSCCWAVLLRAGRGMAKIWLRSVSISNWKLGQPVNMGRRVRMGFKPLSGGGGERVVGMRRVVLPTT